jgi:hypothetical protein
MHHAAAIFGPTRRVVTGVRSATSSRATRNVARRFGPPTPAGVLSASIEAIGHFRVADPGVEGYELYRGVNAEPDLAGAAWETFTSLPHSTASLSVGNTYRFVLRQRNRYGLISENTTSTVITVAGDGTQTATPPSAPTDITGLALDGGVVQISAVYTPAPDGDNAATTWLVYHRTNGTNPDPATDTPAETAMVNADGLVKLTWESAAQADGTTVKVLVRTRRDGTPDADSTNSTIVTVTAETSGPAAVAEPADGFYGRQTRQA